MNTPEELIESISLSVSIDIIAERERGGGLPFGFLREKSAGGAMEPEVFNRESKDENLLEGRVDELPYIHDGA